MRRSPVTLALNALGAMPWVSDDAWWAVSDAAAAAHRRVYSFGTPDGQLWRDAGPAAAVLAHRLAGQVRARLHVPSDPTCERHARPRSRWLDAHSRGISCRRCLDAREQLRYLAQLQADLAGSLHGGHVTEAELRTHLGVPPA